jgi:hypothetical protein
MPVERRQNLNESVHMKHGKRGESVYELCYATLCLGECFKSYYTDVSF